MKKTTSPQKKVSARKRLVLLDAHAIIHRAYHALPEFTSPKGEPTGALYGLSSMLLKIIADLKPDYLVACYDLPGPTYRHEAYEGYKAQRKQIEEDLSLQMERSRDVFKAFGVPIYECPGFEADDILGTIVEKLTSTKLGTGTSAKLGTGKKESVDIIIASGDMDTLQLVQGKRVQVYTLKKGINDTILYNEETVRARFSFAPTSLPDYKGLRGDPSDNIIGIKGIGEKTATILISTFGTIEEMYKTLKKDKERFASLGVTPRVLTLLEEGEEEATFSKMLAQIRRDAPIIFTLPEKRWREGLEVGDVLSLFTELGFRSLSERVKVLFGAPKRATAEGEGPASGAEVDPRELKEASIALWLLHSDTTNPSLDDILTFTKKRTLGEAMKVLRAALKKEKLEEVFEEVERPLIPVIEKMETRGIKIDRDFLAGLSKTYHKELAVLEKKIWKQAGQEFNVNSPRQLGEVLFEKMGLAVKNHKMTGGGLKSTRESELEKMRDSHPIIGDILNYRELQKLLSTYIDNIPHMVDDEGRLHAHFEQTGTTTGRMSSSNPNLQNIPIRTDLGRAIRNAFVSDEGYTLVTFDYSQIELRLAAVLSKDEKLTKIFKSGGDVHTAVAAEVFDVSLDKVDREMRRRAKIINFGILYGMGVNALRANLGTTRAEAQTFYNKYFSDFKGLAEYLENVKAAAYRNGYTTTLFGRRRFFEGIRSSIPYVKAGAERMAINAPIQGTEADIIKLAMIHIDEYLRKEGRADDAHLLLQVHDELVYEMKTDKLKEIAWQIKNKMEEVLPLQKTNGIPITAECRIGKNWGEIEPLILT